MIAKLLEMFTGKDDLERIAYKEDLGQLNAYLKSRTLLIPKRPKHFLEAASFTQEALLKMIQLGITELAGDAFEPWILEVDGKKRLPAFSSQKKMEVCSGKMSQQMDKVFSLGCAECLLADITKDIDIDFVDLNLFCEKSWEICVK
jgi:hypothetical protein